MTTRRSFLKGLFVAPAIVAATNIMPVRAVDMLIKPDGNPFGMKAGPLDLIMTGHCSYPIHGPVPLNPGKLITDIADIQEAAATLKGNWTLVQFKGSNERRWLSGRNAETIKYDHDVIRTMEVPVTHREIDTTVALMKAEPGSGVIWGLTPDMMRPFDYRRK